MSDRLEPGCTCDWSGDSPDVPHRPWCGDDSFGLYDGPDVDDGSDLDPCNYCPHDNYRHRGDGCLDCGCVAAQ